jgi:uncharacterized membrane protein
MQIAEEIIQFFNLIGSLVCHQKPERTLWVGGHYLPVCARDTGACIGLLLGYALLFSLRKKNAKGPPNLYVTLAMMIPLLIDSFGQAFGLWTSTNDIRLITGLLFGTALAPLLVYVLSLSTFGKIPFLKNLMVKNATLDDKNSWFDARVLLVGIICSVILFLAIESIVGSSFQLLYWVLSIPVIAMIIWHGFLLPPILLILALDKLLHR